MGPSGFGKTTMFNLIYRLFDPGTGKVLLDGQDVSTLQMESFRQRMTIVPQNGILFNDTILFNLRYGNPDASIEEVQDVCRRC